MNKQDHYIDNMIKLAKSNLDIAVLWLYGSQAKGHAYPDSDYDLAIAFQTFPQDALERRLRPELIAIDWSLALQTPERKISIVDINLIPTTLAWEVISTGRVLYAKDEFRRIKEENRIASMYELDVLYHRKRYGT